MRHGNEVENKSEVIEEALPLLPSFFFFFLLLLLLRILYPPSFPRANSSPTAQLLPKRKELTRTVLPSSSALERSPGKWYSGWSSSVVFC